jgi:hypothetical protein
MHLIASSVLIVLAAIQVPQTRTEFIDAVAAGKGPTTVETITVERNLAEVYELLQEKSAECLDIFVKRSGNVGTHVEVSSSDYNPTLERIDENRATFTLQVIHNPRGVGHSPPPGGLYMMAVDLTALGGDRTEVVVYRPTWGFKKIAASFRQWIDGNDTRCPKLR